MKARGFFESILSEGKGSISSVRLVMLSINAIIIGIGLCIMYYMILSAHKSQDIDFAGIAYLLGGMAALHTGGMAAKVAQKSREKAKDPYNNQKEVICRQNT